MIRPACAEDADAVSDIVLARSGWLEERGLPSWRADVKSVSVQTQNPDGAMYVLEADGRPVGCTTLLESTPPMAWTEEELAEPAFYLYTTITHPETASSKPGTLIALWAVDRAAKSGKLWVRRGCRSTGLVSYYQRQKFTLIHEMQKTHGPMYLMGRRAERIKDLEDRFKGLVAPSAP
ncbi:GNAT family N-acetyltransferase [Streptomyces sp. NPDC059255]|uniref:GNAT family N-acetyltransferase n=1 Tax=Streptomyces sp. NPDC059255 TaxID=3346793 RepID=UPI0036B7666A